MNQNPQQTDMIDTKFNKEAEVLTSGGATVEIHRGSKHTNVQLKILHHADDNQTSDEELQSQIRAALEARAHGSHWQKTIDFSNLTRKLLDKVESKLVAFEVSDETNDPTFLRSASRMLNECRTVLPRLVFDLEARRMEVESILECIRLDNEPESEPRQIEPLPMSPAQPVSPSAVNSTTSNTKPPQNSGNGQNEKSVKSRTNLPPSLTERLKAFKKTSS